MKFFLSSLLLLPAGISAFTSSVSPTTNNILSSSSSTTTKTKTGSVLNAASMNDWVPDSSKFAYGLPGSLEPVGEFDPLGFAADADLQTMKRYREAETTHGRVAMLAVIGFLVQESGFHPLFNTADKSIGPAIRHLDEVRAASPIFFEVLIIGIGAAEFNRALSGWEKPGNAGSNWQGSLQADYFPGDIGFDPLGLKPDNFAEFSEMSTKELQHGRLAMLASAGFIAQELVNEKGIFENIGA